MSDRWRREYGDGRSFNDRNERYERDHDRYDRYYGYDRNDRNDYYARSRSPSPRNRGTPRNADYEYEEAGRYKFRGAAANTHRNGRPHDNFSFRAPGPPAPYFPPEDRNLRQPQRRERRPYVSQERERVDQLTHVSQASRGRNRGGRRGGRPGHARDILHKTHRGGTPEQLEGMNLEGQTRFLNIESSDEESSDVNSVIDLTADSDDVEEGEVPRKRVKTEAEPAHEQDVPKWSNPDPYTSLPPPETLGAPKKDIVQTIRKAKVDSGPKGDSTNAVKENVDFISFNFDDDSDSGTESVDSVLVNAPSAPATMSRRNGVKENHVANGHSMKLGDHTTSYKPIKPPVPTTEIDDGVGPPPPPPNGFVMPTDDELAGMLAGSKGKKRKREQQSKDVGDVLPEWEADDSDPVPWCSVDYTRIRDPGLT